MKIFVFPIVFTKICVGQERMRKGSLNKYVLSKIKFFYKNRKDVVILL